MNSSGFFHDCLGLPDCKWTPDREARSSGKAKGRTRDFWRGLHRFFPGARVALTRATSLPYPRPLAGARRHGSVRLPHSVQYGWGRPYVVEHPSSTRRSRR